MIRNVLSQYPHAVLNGFALLLFLAVFVGVVFWIYRKSSNDLYEEMKKLPLEDANNE